MLNKWISCKLEMNRSWISSFTCSDQHAPVQKWISSLTGTWLAKEISFHSYRRSYLLEMPQTPLLSFLETPTVQPKQTSLHKKAFKMWQIVSDDGLFKAKYRLVVLQYLFPSILNIFSCVVPLERTSSRHLMYHMR